MKRMRKAFIIGTMEVDSAVMILRRAYRRPKRRTTRKARMRRRTVTGMLASPRATRDMRTMKASSRLQGLARKGRSQWAKRLTSSSAVKTAVKASLAASMPRPSAVWRPAPSESWLTNCDSSRFTTKFCI